jgi:hypothetical protein
MSITYTREHKQRLLCAHAKLKEQVEHSERNLKISIAYGDNNVCNLVEKALVAAKQDLFELEIRCWYAAEQESPSAMFDALSKLESLSDTTNAALFVYVLLQHRQWADEWRR